MQIRAFPFRVLVRSRMPPFVDTFLVALDREDMIDGQPILSCMLSLSMIVEAVPSLVRWSDNAHGNEVYQYHTRIVPYTIWFQYWYHTESVIH
eukprot:scaffold44678_cov451-Amphora_coffeaeformis.AAC.2